jgi:NTP pyrophosphatase (non-canonical NTP hydrolase)
MDKFTELNDKIISWAGDKGILKHATTKSQFSKTLEEVKELEEAIQTYNKLEMIDAIGDVTVTLIILCKLNNIEFIDCLKTAYNVIKNREGKMVNGVFVKNG